MSNKNLSPLRKWLLKSANEQLKETIHLPVSSRRRVIELSTNKSKARDQLARILATASTEVREKALEENDEAEGLSDFVVESELSNGDVDSHDSTINPDGWDLEAFRANPVVLFAHNSWELPIGRDFGAHVAEVDGRKTLRGVTRFVSKELDAFGDQCGKFVRAGILRGVSVGFQAQEFEESERDDGDSWFPAIDFMKQQLREYSYCPVPSNPRTLADVRAIDGEVDEEGLNVFIEGMVERAGGLWVPPNELMQARGSRAKIVVDLGKRNGGGVFAVRAEEEEKEEEVKDPLAIPEIDDVEASMPDDDEAERKVLTCPSCGHTAAEIEFSSDEESSEDEDEERDEDDTDEEKQLDEDEEKQADDEEEKQLEDEEEEEEEKKRVAEIVCVVSEILDEIEMQETGRLP